MKAIVLTVIFDGTGSRQWRTCGKLWVASLLRHVWGGELIIGRNFPEVLFPTGRMGLTELELPAAKEAPRTEKHGRKLDCREKLYQLARDQDVSEGWVILADADCVALRNLDHLLGGSKEVLILESGGKCDAGFVAVRAECLRAFLDAVEELGLDVAVASGKWSVGEFERGEVLRAGEPGISIEDLAEAAVVHLGGLKPELKLKLAFALHMMAVYGDKDGLFFDMLEA